MKYAVLLLAIPTVFSVILTACGPGDETSATTTAGGLDIPREDLFAEWLFAGDTADTSDSDADLSFQYGELTNDRLNRSENAVYVGGITQLYVGHIPAFSFGGNFSASLWVKLYRASEPQIFIGKCEDQVDSGFLIGVEDSQVYARFGGGIRVDGGMIDSEEWTHVAVSYQSRSGINLYLNGELIASTNLDLGAMIDNTSSIVAGQAPWGSTLYGMIGALDDIRLYHRALTSTHISALYSENDYDGNSSGFIITTALGIIKHIATDGDIVDVEVYNDYAYVCRQGAGVSVIDMSEINQASIIRTITLPNDGMGMTARGNYLYVGNSSGGLYVIDIANPSLASLIRTVDTAGSARDVAVNGDYAYIAAELEGLQIVNITNPSAAFFVTNLETSDRAYGVTVSGDRAYLAVNFSGVDIVNITDPLAPTLITNLDTPGIARAVTMDGDYLYVADHSQGIRIIDLNNLSITANYPTSSYAYDIFIRGNYGIIANNIDGIDTININDPLHPAQVTGVDTAGSARKVTVNGSRIYVADATNGLVIMGE